MKPPSLRNVLSYTGRLAPSPTGLLHLGHAATFWAAYQRALEAGGTLLFRDDDLDAARAKPEFAEAMVEDLRWLGIEWSGEIVRQSERVPLYRAAMEQLLRGGFVYPCACSRRDLVQMINAPHDEGGSRASGVAQPAATHDPNDEPVYPGRCRPSLNLARESGHIQPQTNYRFRVQDGEAVRFVDELCGPQSYVAGCVPHADFGDFLIWRKDGLPSYQLACVMDDAAMGITEVVRGCDLLKSTARQILLQRALALPTPAYRHTSLLRDTSGKRLAKRHDALAIRTLREQGLTPTDVLTMVQSFSQS